jgi:hypothetical protein
MGETTLMTKLRHTWPTSLLAALLALAPLCPAQDAPPAAKKDKAKEKKPAAAATTAEPAQKSATGFNIPIPIGQTSSGVVVQNIDSSGDELGVMKANEATRLSLEEVELGDLRLKVLGTVKQPQEMNISIDKAVFNVKTGILKSRSRVHIQRSDWDLYGDALEYDTNTGNGQLFGEVTMIVHDTEKLTAPPKPAGPAGDVSDAGAAGKTSLAVP